MIRRLARRIRYASRQIGRLSQISQRLRSRARLWSVARHEKKCPTATRSAVGSVATGFAWRAENIGGVRRHLECLQEYSRFPVSVYPSTFGSTLLSALEKESYHHSLSYQQLRHHDLFHSHVDPRFIDICKMAQRDGKPWVHTYHLLYFPDDWGGELQRWQVDINSALTEEARKADFRIAVGSWLVDLLWNKYQIQSTYIPNGVDLAACDLALGDRFRQRFGVSDFVLFVNSILSVKNPLAFIKQAERMPGRTFVMIGSGLTRQSIESELSVTLPTNLVALGPLPHAMTLDAIAACRAFVMTSRREGLPTVLLEAMALRKPCVVPNAPWFADAITCPSHGFTYEFGDADSLNSALHEALNTSEMPLARQHVIDEFSWPVVMEKTDQVYSRLLAKESIFLPRDPKRFEHA